MKKYIISGIAVLAIAAVAAWNVSMNSQNSGLSDIQLANVEALAQESGGGRVCYNSITTNESKTVFYCGTCTFVSGDSTWYSGTGNCP